MMMTPTLPRAPWEKKALPVSSCSERLTPTLIEALAQLAAAHPKELLARMHSRPDSLTFGSANRLQALGFAELRREHRRRMTYFRATAAGLAAHRMLKSHGEMA